jgi:hypothetical protein
MVKRLVLLSLLGVALVACGSTPTPGVFEVSPTSTPMPPATPTPRPPTPTPSGLSTVVFSESVKKQVFRDWVDAKNSGMGDEEACAEIVRGWGIKVDHVKAIVAEGIEKGWLPTATIAPIPPPPTATPSRAAEPAFDVKKVRHAWLSVRDMTSIHAAVEIKNTGTHTARLRDIAFTVYDVNGKVLDAIPAWWTVPRVIRPGEVVYAVAERLHEDLEPATVGELKVNFDYDLTSEEPQLLAVENLSGGEGQMGYEVTGEVVNTSGESAGEIRVAVALYDEGNNLLGVLWAYPQVTLAPGDRMGFVALSLFSFPPEVGKQVKRLVGVAHNLKW